MIMRAILIGSRIETHYGLGVHVWNVKLKHISPSFLLVRCRFPARLQPDMVDSRRGN